MEKRIILIEIFLKKDNCYNNCSEAGQCNCDGITCTNQSIYTFPTTSNDSYGICECNSNKSNLLYDCTEIPTDYFWVYVGIGIAFFMLMLVIAIAVPIICFIQRKRKSDYEKI